MVTHGLAHAPATDTSPGKDRDRWHGTLTDGRSAVALTRFRLSVEPGPWGTELRRAEVTAPASFTSLRTVSNWAATHQRLTLAIGDICWGNMIAIGYDRRSDGLVITLWQRAPGEEADGPAEPLPS